MINRGQKAKKFSRKMSADVLAVELGMRNRFVGPNYGGHRISGIDSGARGVLAEPYWSSAAGAVYAVYSYNTPIAWELADGTWVVPEHRYSGTTSRQQVQVREALGLLGIPYTGGL